MLWIRKLEPKVILSGFECSGFDFMINLAMKLNTIIFSLAI
jgi:hypothetical protein